MTHSQHRQDGAAIRQTRRQRGMRSGELARRAEITRRHLTTVENGNRQGSWELLYRIARELDVEITDILSDHGREELAEVGAA